MLKRIFSASTLLVFLLFLCAGCGNEPSAYDNLMDQLAEASNSSPETEEREFSGRLTITASFSSLMVERFESTANAYMEQNPNVEIVLDNHEIQEDYVERLPVMLMSDQIGDLVFLPSTLKMQTINETNFVNLFPLMEQDTDFSEDDYFMNILTAYQTDGNLYCLCTRFMPMGIYMARNDVSTELTYAFESKKTLSYNDILELYLDSSSSNDRNFSRDFNPMELFTYNYDSLVDFEAKEAHFDSEEFLEFLEQVKNQVPINEENIEYTADGLMRRMYTNSQWNYSDVTDVDGTFVFKDIGSAVTASLYPFADRVFTSPKFLTTSAGNYLFITFDVAAISNTCENQELAWDFLKFWLREIDAPQVQEETAMEYYHAQMEYRTSVIGGAGYPVNRSNFKSILNLEANYTYFIVGAAQDEEDKADYLDTTFDFMTMAAEQCNLPFNRYNDLFDYGEAGMIWDDMYLYLIDRQSVEQTMANIQNKVKLWLNE